jgi:O-methyltransferase involved in polyketide biosynthesis
VAVETVALSGAAQTLLITLHAHVLDERSAHPLLADTRAVEIAGRLDYDFSRLELGASMAAGIAVRALLLDRWTLEFLDRHPEAVVLHLGCGLDSRAERIDPGPGVRWFDVDQPDVLALRERVYRPRTGYRPIPASATDPTWLSQVPRDLPTIVVAEGLTMYLPVAEGLLMLNHLVEHLRCGEMAFDTVSRFGMRSVARTLAVRRSEAQLGWAVDDPRSLEQQVPGLRLVSSRRAFELADRLAVVHAPWTYRLACALFRRVPVLRDVGHTSRFTFGPGSC